METVAAIPVQLIYTPMRLAIPISLLILGSSCSTAPEQPKAAAKKAQPAKIIHFYPGKPEIALGETVQLCYGVDNTVSVKIDPVVEPVQPMFNKCIEATPKKTTVYTLTAEGAGGGTARQAVTVRVGAARAAAASGGPSGPRFYDLVVTAMKVKAGNPWSFCFKAEGARSVTASAGRFTKGGNPAGDCIVDAPQKTTTYVVTATAASGASTKETVTVAVEP